MKQTHWCGLANWHRVEMRPAAERVEPAEHRLQAIVSYAWKYHGRGWQDEDASVCDRLDGHSLARRALPGEHNVRPSGG